MKPAASIIFFTVASGAGLGLLAVTALFDVFGPSVISSQALWRSALLGLVLVAAGLASSTLHLANPRNAWRAFARVRTSWLSREAALAVVLFAIAAVYMALTRKQAGGAIRTLLALATAVASWSVLFCTAMIYASLKPIRQWHTPWTPTNYILLGHWSGALLFAATASAYAAMPSSLGIVATALGLLALAAKLGYWYADLRGAPTTLAHAIGVDQGVRGPGMSIAQARLLDVVHSQPTFLTREFGFVLARRHAGALRLLAVVLGFVLPLALLTWGPTSWESILAAAACCMMGLLVERWLFFAEAKHTVRLYHGETRT